MSIIQHKCGRSVSSFGLSTCYDVADLLVSVSSADDGDEYAMLTRRLSGQCGHIRSEQIITSSTAITYFSQTHMGERTNMLEKQDVMLCKT